MRGGGEGPDPGPGGAATVADDEPTDADRRGYTRLGRVGGVPVWVHWSLPAGGLFAALFGSTVGLGPRHWLYYTLAYGLLVLAHEAGHALAAVGLGLRVSAVEVSGTGGVCRSERPGRVRDAAILYAAGLAVQAVLFVGALGALAAFGPPAGPLGRAFVDTFTLFNAVMFVINAVPQTQSVQGHDSDGSMLWRLWLHVRRGQPHPLPPRVFTDPEVAPVFPPDTRLLERPGFRPPGFVSGIEILSDRDTPLAFVAAMLQAHLGPGLTRAQAEGVALDIHNTGGMVFGYPEPHKAFEAARAITEAARHQGFPLVCRYAGPVELLDAA